MKNFTIPADAVRCAMLYIAKQDVRFYLNGFYVDNKSIFATNGHVLFAHDFPEQNSIPDGESVIIKLIGTIPAKAKKVTFNFSDDLPGVAGIAICQDIMDQVVAVLRFVTCNGRFPDIRKLLSKHEAIEGSADRIAFNAAYMAIIEKTAKIHDRRSLKVVMRNKGDSNACFFDFSGYEMKSTAVVMPMLVE